MSHYQRNRDVQRYDEGRRGGEKRSRRDDYHRDNDRRGDRRESYMPDRRPPDTRHGGKGGGRGRGFQRREPLKIPNQEVIPEEVSMAKQLITLLCNFSDESFDFKEVHSNLIEMAEALADEEVGDLNKFAKEISGIFVKCFSQLTVQIPIVSTLLSLIARKNSSFAALVVSNLFAEMIMSLGSGDVIVARNHLRCFACLTATGLITLSTEVSSESGSCFLDLLLSLVEIAEEEVEKLSVNSQSMSVSSQASIYLLASTVPYIATELHSCNFSNLSSRIAALCRKVSPNSPDCVGHKSLYDCNNTHSVFHVNIEGTQSPSPALDCFTQPIRENNEASEEVSSSISSCPAGGSVCWDTLWESCRVADNVLTAVELTDGACYRYNENKYGFCQEENVYYLPKCLFLVWQHDDIQTALQEPLAPIPSVSSDPPEAPAATPSLDPEEQEHTDKKPDNKEIPPPYTNYSLSPLLLIQNNVSGTPGSVRDAIRETILSPEFSAMAGPEADYYRRPSGRDKTMSNSSAGYAAWVGLRLNLYDEESVDESIAADAVAAITGLSFLELSFARDFFRSTVRFFEPFMRDNGTSVGSFELLYKHLSSVYMLFPSGKHLEYVLMEALLLMIIQVPPLNACLVQRVILELCNRDPGLYGPVLAVGCNALFNLMPAMDVCSWRELSSLLTVYLTNKGRVWPYWSYWGDEYTEIIAAEDMFNPQKIFLDMLIGRLTRMCGYDQNPGDRMRNALPASLRGLITLDQSHFLPSCSLYGIDSQRRRVSPFASEVLDKLNQRLSADDFAEWFSADHESAGSDVDESNRVRYLVEGLLTFVCEGSNSQGGTLSAVRNILERYRKALVKTVSACEDGSSVLVETAVSCLHHQPALLDMFLDWVMRYGILHPAEASAWFCRDISESSESMSPVDMIHISNVATNHWVWTYLQTCINRCMDMMKVAFSRRSAHVKASQSASHDEDEQKSKRLKSSEGNSEITEVEIPTEIVEIVQNAEESCQEAYGVIVSKLLIDISDKSASLVEEGKEEEAEIKELDGKLISTVSLLHQVLRCFHLTETMFSRMALTSNTSPVTLTSKEFVDTLVENSRGSSDLVGVSGKIWKMFNMK